MATRNQIDVGLSGASGSGAFAGSASPTFTTPTIGAATVTTLNKYTVTPTTGTLAIADNKTLTYDNSIALSGTDGATYTFPSTSSTLINNSLTSARMFIGNGSNVATGVAISGELTLDNTGAFTVANSAVTNAKIATNVIQTTVVAVSSAEFLAMYATPKQIIAAAGAGTIIIPLRLFIYRTYNSVQYTAGGNVVLQYGNTAAGAGVSLVPTLNSSNFTGANSTTAVFSQSNTVILSASTINAGLFLSNDTTAYLTGNSAFKVEVWYAIVTGH